MGGAGVLNLQLILLFSSGSTPYVAVSTYVLTLLQSLTKLQIHHNLSLFLPPWECHLPPFPF